MTSFNLTSPLGRASVTVDCDHGGRIASFIVDGQQLTVTEAALPYDWGFYPMVPFAGRIAEGRLDFEGRSIQLPTNIETHAMHGYGFISEWKMLDENSIAYDFADPWPWSGRAVQRFELEDDSLVCTIGIEAIDRQPMQIGWHPWFRRDIGNGHEVALDFAADRMWLRGDDGMPTGAQIAPTKRPWDDCFAGVAGDPQISWGDFTLTLSSTLNEWTVFDGHPNGVCVEPQLGPPNQANTAPFIMASSDVLEEQFTIAWS